MRADFDIKIIEAVQEAYLWLFDRTGASVGMVMFGFIALADAIVVYRHGASWLLILSLATAGFVSFSMVARQTISAAAFNLTAYSWRKSVVRMAMNIVTAAVILSDLLRADRGLAALSMLFVMVGMSWLPAIHIRDREPPENRKLAPQGGGA